MRYILALTIIITSMLVIAPSRTAVAHTLPLESAAVILPQEAATPTPSPTPDQEKERLEREKDLATLRKDKAEADKAAAEARKAEMEAKFPKPTTSPLEGKTTVEGAVIESQMISYVSLGKAADRIIEKIKDNWIETDSSGKAQVLNKNLAIYNERDINLMLSYKVANAQIDLIQLGYTKLLTSTSTVTPCSKATAEGMPGKGPETLALSAAESFLGAFVDMTALLRTNVEIKGQTFVIDEGPLAAEVLRAAKDEKGIKGNLYYPYVFPPNLSATDEFKLLAHLEDVHKLRILAEKLLGDLAKTSKDLSDANDKIKQLKESIEKTIPKQMADAIAAAGNIIKANCRKLSADVDGIKNLPLDPTNTQPLHLQSEAMVKLIEKARVSCRQMDPDKLEQLLGLSDMIVKLGKQLDKANQDLPKANQDEKELECKLRDLESKLDLGTITDPTDPDEVKEHADTAVARLKALNAQFDSLVNAMTQADAGGANMLTNYLRIEKLNSALPVADSYWLVLKVINAGGNNRIKTNLLVDIFTGGNRVSHSGGVIVQYHLFDSDGISKSSGTISEYAGYVRASKVREMTQK